MTFDKFSDMIFPVTKKGSFFCRGLQQQFFYMIKAGKASKSFSLLFFFAGLFGFPGLRNRFGKTFISLSLLGLAR